MLNINKKNALAVALLAGLGMAGSAGAFTLTTGGNAAPVVVATADIINATTDIGINEVFNVALTGGDNILGRTTGFTIRYTLSNGATFGSALTTADLTVGDDAYGSVPSNAWIPTIAAGGGTADGYVVILFSPPVAPVGAYGLTVSAPLSANPGLLNIRAANLVVGPTLGVGQILDDLTYLQVVANPRRQIIATVQFVDPVTAANIMVAQTLPILESGDPVRIACSTALGDVNKTIDVGAVPAKTYFSSTGIIGAADSGYINLGTIDVTRAAGFSSFNFAGTDSFVTTLNGDFSAFAPPAAGRSVFLSSSSTCATSNVAGVVNNTNGTVTFTYTGATVGITATGFSQFVCASVPAGNTVEIDASNVSTSTVFTRGSVTSNGGSTNCPLLPLRYNGSVVDVYHVNPAGNTTAQSFIRVINPSDTPGKVTLTGIDDNGVSAAAPITFTLGARKSMQINSIDLESGNVAKGLTGAWGDGAGKWRGTVTGEFPDMLVQGLNRNAVDGTVTNLTDADNQGEQVLNDLFN